MLRVLFLISVMWCILLSKEVHAQSMAIKTNLVEWVTVTPNIGIEFVLSPKTSFELSSGFNLMNFSTKLRHFRIQPEFKYWFQRPFVQHAIGFTTLYISNNCSFGKQNWEGDCLGAGISYGYSLVLSRRFNMEFSTALGAVYYRQKNWKDKETTPTDINESGVTIAPLKAAFSLVYILR